jgi:hypothetical protein
MKAGLCGLKTVPKRGLVDWIPNNPCGTFVWAKATQFYLSNSCTTSEVISEGVRLSVNPHVSIIPSTLRWSLTVKGTFLCAPLSKTLSILTSASAFKAWISGLRQRDVKVLKVYSQGDCNNYVIVLLSRELSTCFINGSSRLNCCACLFLSLFEFYWTSADSPINFKRLNNLIIYNNTNLQQIQVFITHFIRFLPVCFHELYKKIRWFGWMNCYIERHKQRYS